MSNTTASPPAGGPTSSGGRAMTHVATVTALLVAVGSFGAAATGLLKPVVDWFNSSDQTTSQLTAMAERLRILEANDAERLKGAQVDRAEAGRMAREIEKRIEEATRSGGDVDDLQIRLREVELRLERLSTQIEIFRGRRG